MKIYNAFLVLCLFITSSLNASSITLSGYIHTNDNHALILSHIHVKQIGSSLTMSMETDRTGKYQISVPWTGYLLLKFTGVFHKMDSILIYVDSNNVGTLNIDVELEPILWTPYQNINLVYKDESTRQYKFIEMHKDSNNEYYAYVENKTGTLAYEIAGIRNGSVNGTMQDFYKYDLDGDYFSVIKSKDTLIKITLDPEKYPKISKKFYFTVNDSATNYFARIYHALVVFRRDFTLISDSLRRTNPDKLKAIIRDHLSDLSKMIDSNKDNNILYLIYLDYLSYAWITNVINYSNILNNDIIENVYNVVPPESMLWIHWATDPSIMIGGLYILGKTDSMSYVDKAIINHPNDDVRKSLLVNAIDLFFGILSNKVMGTAYYKYLLSTFPQSYESKLMITKYSRLDSNLQSNLEESLLSYQFSPLDARDETVLIRNYKGKYLLVNFWATWCGPCLHEIEILKDISKKFTDRLTILSISFDKDRSKAERFIRSKDLQWIHTIEESGFESEIAKNTGINGIPFTVLFDPEGHIVASGMELNILSLKEKINNIIENSAIK